MGQNVIDLCTLAEAKAWPGDTGASDDVKIQRLITEASAYFVWRTGRGPENSDIPASSPFVAPVSYTETYDGIPSYRLPLRNWPIRSVQSLTIQGIAVPASTGYGTPGYVIDGNGKSISIPSQYGTASPMSFQRLGQFYDQNVVPQRGRPFNSGLQSIVVSYTAGFNLRAVANELALIPASAPYQYQTLSVWESDTSVFYSGGAQLTKVPSGPTIGEYSVSSGLYQFAAADAGRYVLISYMAAGTPYDVNQRTIELVAVNYKRSQWIDLGSKAMANGAGSTIYRGWKTFPKYEECVEYYSRSGFMV